MKKINLFLLAACLVLSFCLTGCSEESMQKVERITGGILSTASLSSPEDINLRSDDGYSYYFTYQDEDFYAEYYDDVWTIYNSYRITSSHDILIICRALSEEHPIHGRDMESYRTPTDMAFEWEQHNLAYEQLPEDNAWRESAKNVDLDPQDQGKTFKEIYEDRTGKEITLDDVYEKKDKILEKVKEKLKEVLE